MTIDRPSFRRFTAPMMALGAGLFLASCLPKDTRPVPGSINVTVTADPLLLGGHPSVSTTDGWTVSYDRFLIALNAQLGEDSTCASYYNDGYRRILDAGIPGPQKLNLLYALGHCEFGYRVASAAPTPFQPVGRGITPADVTLMQTGDTDPYTTGRRGQQRLTGVALYAKGRATRDGVTKTFTWAFRQGVSYQSCAAPVSAPDGGLPFDAGGGQRPGAPAFRDAGLLDAAPGAFGTVDAGVYFADGGGRGVEGVDLVSGGSTTIDIRIHGESLFLDSTNLATGTLRFDILAAADDKYGNGDGDIALSELGQVPLTDIGIHGRYVQLKADVDAAPGRAVWSTLEDFVYLGLFSKVARFEDKGTCVTGFRGR